MGRLRWCVSYLILGASDGDERSIGEKQEGDS
jgi:hypothetical protein